MPLHFDAEEFAERRARACQTMTKQGLDGLLIFRQESMYYLTGYDTFGYVFFQCLVLEADGRTTLLTRAPDLRQAEQTSDITDIRIWVDLPEANPAEALRALLEERGLKNAKLGVEYEAYGLTAANGKRLETALAGCADLTDTSLLVSRQRLVKSPAEILYLRRGAELADAALSAAERLTEPGAYEGDILAEMQGAIYRGGGDDPANEFIIGSGPQALLCRYHTGRRHIEANDQLTLEWAGVYRHYHAAMMRTLLVGRCPEKQREMHAAARDALLAVEEKLRPGNTVGEAFDAHAQTLDKAGYREARMNACGYAMGTTFAPNWMDWPMLYHANPVMLRPGMVFFVHIIIFDSEAGLAMTLGRSSLIGETAAEPLSQASLDLSVN
ncbi:M24 family metallopeptidase [Algihabitans albus]|uniref:M24 family metallopeptidase n=1 Tax=Algihabitans albus TaxID=2164067 RepID=UPI000E5D918C|nr:Xaa-Pro peptidase family protein [Algihabitans albus]